MTFLKRAMTLILTVALAAVCLSGCGAAKEKTVDLNAFYQSMDEKYDWSQSMVDLTDDLLEGYYPGLKDLSAGTLIAKMPMMSSVVNEIVLVECASEDDAAKAAEILQKRIDDQAAGGAWYPDSMEAWSNGQVYTEGKYAAMIASAEHQDEIGEAFTKLFA